ncbi:hypothetical protein Y032_0017g3249 [Ancylostoma ceylanicum]|uniref:Uncharacterized protein n=1 Tax=Ancylostoma ceylanicum TaxID=53326 RepID=A0A016V5H5_9BILA|nr:hypothetical protein Y032_0017g3249 [Ancylostoma ceylanicum]
MLQVSVQGVWLPSLRPPFWSFSRYFEIKAYFADGVCVGAQNVAVPSKGKKGALHGSVICLVIANDGLVRKCVTIWGKSLTGLAVGRGKSGKIGAHQSWEA